MIKAEIKKHIYHPKKSKRRLFFEYLRTFVCSLLFAAIFTLLLAVHARNDMIKNFYLTPEEQLAINKRVAKQLIAQTDLMNGLANNNCLICMQVGYLYETAGEYENAQKAFELAVQKSPANYYKPYYHLICVLALQDKFDEAEKILSSIKDHNNRKLIMFKSKAYMVMGDEYYSVGKFLSAAKSYEKADFYYNKFAKKKKKIASSIKESVVASYINVADIMVASGKNSDAIRYLEKAQKYDEDNFIIRYKLAVILSDYDPEKAVECLEVLLKERPQDIDYGIYNKALVNAALISEYNGNYIKAKLYRYKIYSIDMYLNRKVIYKNDIETSIKSFGFKKGLTSITLKANYGFLNQSANDIPVLNADFVLMYKDKPIETITEQIAYKGKPLLIYMEEPRYIRVNFSKKIFNRKILEKCSIKVYLYKDEKFKTMVYEHKIPKKAF